MCFERQRLGCGYKWEHLSERIKADLPFHLYYSLCSCTSLQISHRAALQREIQARSVTEQAKQVICQTCSSPTLVFFTDKTRGCHHQTVRNLIQAMLMCLSKAFRILGASSTSGKEILLSLLLTQDIVLHFAPS